MANLSIEAYLNLKGGQSDYARWYSEKIAESLDTYNDITPDETYDMLVCIACQAPGLIKQVRALMLISLLAERHVSRGEDAIGRVAKMADDPDIQMAALAMIGQGKIESQIGAVMLVAVTGNKLAAACADAVLMRMLERALADA